MTQAVGVPRARILLIEDDASINEIVADHLARRGFGCTRAFSGTEARLLLERDRFDLVVTDLMLPGMPGDELVALIRASDAATPIIVVSARTAPADKVDLLKLGADDYLSKPFDLDELSARIEVQLRHRAARCEAAARAAGEGAPGVSATPATGAPAASATLGFFAPAASAPVGGAAPSAAGRSAAPAPVADGRILRLGRWQVDRAARTLEVDGADVPLTRTEFNILELLASHPKRVFTKQELFETVWGEPYATEDSTVNVHVSNLRHKLRPSGTDAYIQTVWGLGFKITL
ncbi:response regulator transcription factor [Adlercreutzia faecimuris]|uniref:Response regulator transcription factor n=1 Tax=Adlercreutzia faecimuris TaxID=2897341 RepID=A0ABS9WDV8_9ACTN|nr:response regulator transcription factor [Adlercreutzia sp. JBNU-10]MCI2240965.1 response regulator transcription factor [Adlercreutzia sp. JBNU-10]